MRKFVTILLTLLVAASVAIVSVKAQNRTIQNSIDRLTSQIAEFEQQIKSILR